jgi:dUTPase
MIEKIKKYKFASSKNPNLPKRGETYAYDLFAHSMEEILLSDGSKLYSVSTEVSVEVPEGHIGLICPKFSLAQQGIIVFNSPNILHNGQIDNIKILLNKWDASLLGKAVAQFVIVVPNYPFEESA